MHIRRIKYIQQQEKNRHNTTKGLCPNSSKANIALRIPYARHPWLVEKDTIVDCA